MAQPGAIAAQYSVNRVERGRFGIQVGRQHWTLGPEHVFRCYPGMAYRCHHHELIPADSCVTVIYRGAGECQESADLLTRLGRLARSQTVLDPTNRLAYVFREGYTANRARRRRAIRFPGRTASPT